MKLSAQTAVRKPPLTYQGAGGMHIDSLSVAEAYVDKVEELSVGQPETPKLENTDIFTAYQVAASMVGVPAAVALAGEVMEELCGPGHRQELDRQMLADEGIALEAQLPGTAVPIGFGNPEELGQANFASITLDPQLRDFLGAPLGDFIAGHELGHLERGDLLRQWGQTCLQSVFAQVSEEHAQEIGDASDSLARQAEFRADRAGVDYALKRGHAPEKIVEATDYLLDQMAPEGDAHHPPTAARKRAIRSYLEDG